MTFGDPPIGLKLIERPREVEASLWRRLRFENQAACREAIFSNYHSLARGIALHEYRRRPAYGLERSDFEQLAFGGLLEAIDRYDPMRGAPFSAYARIRIRGAISDGIARSSEDGARYSHRRRSELERLKSVRADEPTRVTDPIAELSDIAIALAIGLVAESSSAPDQAAPDGSSLTGYHSIHWQELQISVLREIERLPGTERSILQQHYLKDVSFKLIAEMLGLSKGRVSQLHRAALKKVRLRLRPPE
jgi:RNA polymerase sigma factor for flagellar operon FliA